MILPRVVDGEVEKESHVTCIRVNVTNSRHSIALYDYHATDSAIGVRPRSRESHPQGVRLQHNLARPIRSDIRRIAFESRYTSSTSFIHICSRRNRDYSWPIISRSFLPSISLVNAIHLHAQHAKPDCLCRRAMDGPIRKHAGCP